MRRQAGIIRRLARLLACAGVLSTTTVRPASAQYAPCPDGYGPDPFYGCIPLGYLYGPLFYPYPVYGFDFFYGPDFETYAE